MDYVDFLFDPTCLFTIGVVLVPCIFLDSKGIVQYLTTPMMLLSFVYLAMIVYFTHSGKTFRLSPRDRRIAFWFLCNGIYYNLFLDVVSGQFQLMDEMSRQYLRVEPRYAYGYRSDAGAPVFMTSMLELFFQSPFCLLSYYAYHRKKPWRHTISILASMLHITGVWYFYVPEALQGFPHFNMDWNNLFSFDNILFFWFGFWFCGILWCVVPVAIMWSAWNEISLGMGILDGKKE